VNAERIAGPRSATWSPSTIYGNHKRGTGVLNNQLYIGQLVWNRQRFIKDPDTGRRVARLNPPEQWTTADVPHLRIVDDPLWRAAKARQVAIRRSLDKGIAKARRPRYLFSGLTVCATCGGGFILGSRDGLICYNARERGTCSNRRRLNRLELEGRVLKAMQERLFDPGCFEDFCRSFTEEMTRLRREHLAAQAGQRGELTGVAQRQKEIMDLLLQGYRSEAWKAELLMLDAKKEQLEAALRVQELPALHPNMAQVYRDKATALAAGLQRKEERDGARLAMRGLLDRIVVPPDGLLQVVGNFGAMLAAAQGQSLSFDEACGKGGCGGGI